MFNKNDKTKQKEILKEIQTLMDDGYSKAKLKPIASRGLIGFCVDKSFREIMEIRVYDDFLILIQKQVSSSKEIIKGYQVINTLDILWEKTMPTEKEGLKLTYIESEVEITFELMKDKSRGYTDLGTLCEELNFRRNMLTNSDFLLESFNSIFSQWTERSHQYCVWLNEMVKDFIHEISALSLHPSFVILNDDDFITLNSENHIEYKGKTLKGDDIKLKPRVRDLLKLEGLGFDYKQQKIVKFNFEGMNFLQEPFDKISLKDAYKYEIYDFDNIYTALVTENNNVTYQTKTSGGFTRALVGGTLFGGVGAIVGSATAPTTTQTSGFLEKGKLEIYLKNSPTPIFTSKFNINIPKNLEERWGKFESVPTEMIQILSSSSKWPFDCDNHHEVIVNKETHYISVVRTNSIDKIIENASVKDGIRSLYAYLITSRGNSKREEVIAEYKDIAFKIDGMIKLSEKDVSAETNPEKVDVSEEIKKLSQLHDEGVLTDDEFASAKGKIISKL